MRFKLRLLDGTVLNDVILTTTRENMSIGELKNANQFYDYLQNRAMKNIMYFGGRYVQGGISHPSIIVEYEIFEDEEQKRDITLICDCGQVYKHIPTKCKMCGYEFIDC